MSMRERYKRRSRHLYALAFDGGTHVYIGQTLDLRRREKEHRRFWPCGFRMVALGSIDGTEADAVDYEHAWRWKARQAGYAVLATNRAGDRFVLHDLMRQMTPQRFALVKTLRWPKELRCRHAHGWLHWIGWAAATSAGLLLVLHTLLGW